MNTPIAELDELHPTAATTSKSTFATKERSHTPRSKTGGMTQLNAGFLQSRARIIQARCERRAFGEFGVKR